MDALPDDQRPAQIEVKIESSLRDTSKIFVETQFTWHKPTDPGDRFDARGRLQQINDYIRNQVVAFITGE